MGHFLHVAFLDFIVVVVVLCFRLTVWEPLPLKAPPVRTPPPYTGPRRMGLNRGPPPPGTASADASPGEGAIRMGQQYHCHTKCYTPGAAVSVMSSGKPHQSQYLQTWSCGLVVRP